MKHVVRKGLKDVIVETVPDPVPPPHHVVVRPYYSLISSGTETASIHRNNLLKEVADNPSQVRKILSVMKTAGVLPTVAEVRAKFNELAPLGYSGAGIIVEKHSTVNDVDIGGRVAYGGEGTGHGETIVTGRHLVAPFGHSVSFRHACFTTLGSIAMNAVRTSNVGLGDNVAVIGMGLVGQLIAQLARLQGARVTTVDLKQHRVDLAQQLGASVSLLADGSVEEAVASLTDGRGMDCVVVAAASKSSVPCRQALKLCRDRGRIVVVGAVVMDFPWDEMYVKEVQLFMARAYGPGSYDPAYEIQGHDYPFAYVRWTENRNMEAFLELIAQQRLQLDALITHEFELETAPLAYDTILDPSSNSLAVLLKYPASDATDPVADYKPTRRVNISAQPPQGTLGVAVVGAGNLARWVHLPAIKAMAGVSLRAIYSTNAVRGKSYGRRFRAEYCCTDYDEVLIDPNVHLVLVVSRNNQHAAHTVAALRAGKHVFVEKPMALTEQECRDIAAAAFDSGKQVTVGFNRRFAPFYVSFKERLKRRTGPAVLNCRINSPGISGSYWMADPANGGAVLGEACHFVDLMYWLLESEPAIVSAYCLPRGQNEPIGQNNVVASFRFEDGSIATLTYCTVGSNTSGGERVEAYAQGIGIMSEDFRHLAIKGTTVRTMRKYWADKGYKQQLTSFITSLRQEHRPEVTLRDGVRATIGCLQMLKSAGSMHPCEIDVDSILNTVRVDSSSRS